MGLTVRCPDPNPPICDTVNSTFNCCGFAPGATTVTATVQNTGAMKDPTGSDTPRMLDGWWCIQLSGVNVTPAGGRPYPLVIAANFPPFPPQQTTIPIKVVAAGGTNCDCTPPGFFKRLWIALCRLFGGGPRARGPDPRPDPAPSSRSDSGPIQ